MTTKLGKVGMRTFAGALLAGPVIAACSSGPTYDQWATTDGAAGRINLDEVQAGFKKAKSVTDFERRVNEIYEGDGIVLIRARQETDALVIEGWEDLNKNFEIDDTEDDKLFEITERNKQHELRGYGGNSYYNRGFGGGDFLFTYLLISSLSPRGYYYNTSPVYARGSLTNYRNSYRGSSRYQTQVSRNSRYFSNKGGFSDSKYNSSKNNLSTARKSYRSTQNSTGSFKSSKTGVRSSWGASSRSGGFRGGGRRGGGFRGFGGGQVIVGPTRGA